MPMSLGMRLETPTFLRIMTICPNPFSTGWIWLGMGRRGSKVRARLRQDKDIVLWPRWYPCGPHRLLPYHPFYGGVQCKPVYKDLAEGRCWCSTLNPAVWQAREKPSYAMLPIIPGQCLMHGHSSGSHIIALTLLLHTRIIWYLHSHWHNNSKNGVAHIEQHWFLVMKEFTQTICKESVRSMQHIALDRGTEVHIGWWPVPEASGLSKWPCAPQGSHLFASLPRQN